MKIPYLVISILVFGIMLFGIGCEKDNPVENEPKTGNVSGYINHNFTLEPISRADINVGEFNTVSNGGGEYGLENIPVGSYTLTITANSFDVYFETVDIVEGNTSHNFRLVPTRTPGTGSIFGPVYDHHTLDNISGAHIYIGYNNNLRDTSVGDYGLYYINNIPPGWYDFMAIAEGYNVYTDEVFIQSDSLLVYPVYMEPR